MPWVREIAWVVVAGALALPFPAIADASLDTAARATASGIDGLPECKSGSLAMAYEGKAGSGTAFGGTLAHSGGTAVAPDTGTIFEIGSITKTFTALLFADAIAQKLVKPDDPAAMYLPAGTVLPSYQQGGTRMPIRLIDLATHTSGLPRDLPDMHYPYSTAQMYVALAKVQVNSAPGTTWTYSNLGFALLAEAMQGVFKEPYSRLIAEQVTAPLGMTHTLLFGDSSDGAQIPVGYSPRGKIAQANNDTWPAFNGAGALRSTLSDMTRYLDFMMSGEGPGMDGAHALLTDFHSFPQADGKPAIQQGLAWQLVRPFGNSTGVIWKDGDVPGFTSYIAYAPSIGEGVVVLTNRMGCKAARAGLCVLEAAGREVGLDASKGPDCAF